MAFKSGAHPDVKLPLIGVHPVNFLVCSGRAGATFVTRRPSTRLHGLRRPRRPAATAARRFVPPFKVSCSPGPYGRGVSEQETFHNRRNRRWQIETLATLVGLGFLEVQDAVDQSSMSADEIAANQIDALV